MAGLGAERAALHDGALARARGMLVKLGRAEIPVHLTQILEAEFVGAVSAVPQTRFLHGRPPNTPSGRRRTPPKLPRLTHGSLNYSARPQGARPIVRIARPAKAIAGLQL